MKFVYIYIYIYILIYIYIYICVCVCVCCILKLERAVNQRFPAQDAPMKTSGSSHVVVRKLVGVMKWYMQMPSCDTDSVSLELVSVCSLRSTSKKLGTKLWAAAARGLQLSTLRFRSRRTKWDIEDNAVRDIQEKKNLWVGIAVLLCLSHTTDDLTPRKNKYMYVFL